MMMRSEDQEHGTHGLVSERPHGLVSGPVRGRNRTQLADDPFEAKHRLTVARQEEQARVAEEPYAEDDEVLKDSDAKAYAYMEVWDHYQAAYNATQYRASLDFWMEQFALLASAILGREVTLGAEDGPSLPKIVHEAAAERGRLLSVLDREVETLAIQAESISSQQRLIQELSTFAMRGKRAFDAFMMLGVKLGINPVPTDPEEFVEAVLAKVPAATQEKEGTS